MIKPKFSTALAWEQANLLMQPAFIRVIDNIRKQLEQSAWKETYQEVQTPYPGYELCLTYQDKSVRVNIWDLCFQVCFLNYNPELSPSTFSSEDVESSYEVEIDTSLLDDETGEIDWQRLDERAREQVEQVFAKLPTV
jgi:hypothetical protein